MMASDGRELSGEHNPTYEQVEAVTEGGEEVPWEELRGSRIFRLENRGDAGGYVVGHAGTTGQVATLRYLQRA